ncbi:MAG: CapA family protein [Gemmatimonadales bacterium]
MPQPVGRALAAPIHFCAGGDVTLGTNLDRTWERAADDSLEREFGLSPMPDSLARQLSPLFAGADLALFNVEGAIGDGPAPRKCKRGSRSCFAFRQPTSTAVALRHAFDSTTAVVGNVANNHSHDAGNAGRDTTIALLEAAGVHVTGADTIATPVALPSGDTVAVLGFYTDVSTPDARDLAAVHRYVSRAVDRWGTVIVTMHLGAEGPGAQRTRNANEIFLKESRGNPVAFADAAFDAGATLVIGHGPHVLRAAEWRGDRLVFYSLGNLLTYGPFKLHDPTDRGAVACATIDSVRHVASAELRATKQIWTGVLLPDSSRRAFTLVDSLSALDFPETGATVDSTGALGRRAIRAATDRTPR